MNKSFLMAALFLSIMMKYADYLSVIISCFFSRAASFYLLFAYSRLVLSSTARSNYLLSFRMTIVCAFELKKEQTIERTNLDAQML